jgi:hypothetical protein
MSHDSPTTNGRWFERHRMGWIDETIRIFGFINREHIQRKFGLSAPQASTDLQRYMKLHPTVMQYNGNTKRYEILAGVRHEKP